MAGLSPLRQGRITASLVGAILGLSPHMTRRDALESMLNKSSFYGNVATEYGKQHEPIAMMDYELITGNRVNESQFYMFQDWLGATPDGEIGQDKLLEIKCPYGKRDGGEFKSIYEQMHYFAQVQIQMLCANKKECDFYQWSPHGNRLENVVLDEEWLDKTLPVLLEFYNEYLQLKQTLLDAKDLLDEHDELCLKIESFTERKKIIMDCLVEIAGHKDATINGRKLTLVKREGSVSYAKAIKDLLPGADLSQYKGQPTEYWKLS